MYTQDETDQMYQIAQLGLKGIIPVNVAHLAILCIQHKLAERREWAKGLYATHIMPTNHATADLPQVDPHFANRTMGRQVDYPDVPVEGPTWYVQGKS